MRKLKITECFFFLSILTLLILILSFAFVPMQEYVLFTGMNTYSLTPRVRI